MNILTVSGNMTQYDDEQDMLGWCSAVMLGEENDESHMKSLANCSSCTTWCTNYMSASIFSLGKLELSLINNYTT